MTDPSALTSSALTGDEDVSTMLGAWNAMIRRARLTDEQKLMCLLVSSYADNDGTNVRCGIATLAVDSRRGYSTARKYMAWMRQVGLIEMVQQGNRREHKADVYRLIVSARLGESVHVMNIEEYDAAKEEVRARNYGGAVERAHRAKHAAQASEGDLRSPKVSGGKPVDNADLRSPSTSAREADLRSRTEASALTMPSAETKHLRSHSATSALTLDERPPPLITSPDLKPDLNPPASALPEPLKMIYESVRRTDPTVTPDEARAVHRLIAYRHEPRSTRYYAKIALTGGFDGYLAEVRGAALEEANIAAATARHAREAEEGPAEECPHLVPGGLELTAAKTPRCPMCRNGVPAPIAPPADITPGQRAVAEAYRLAATEGDAQPIGLVNKVTTASRQARELLDAGVELEPLLAVARHAGRLGIDLITFARQETHA